MGVRYIGSKARIADAIVDIAGPHRGRRFVDAFAGTGAVAATAARRGWRVSVNDALPSSVSMSVAALLSSADVPFGALGGYDRAIEILNGAHGQSGFIHQQYTPASRSHAGLERRYFTESNGARLDAMRTQIAAWYGMGVISEPEHHLLLADLMQAANSVANIAGTYGCFLSSWSSTALRSVEVKRRPLALQAIDYTASVGDVSELETESDDVVYFDPPYTKRQYSAYYHLLETIHAGDEPEVTGVTGLRPWKDKASDFSYRSRALTALIDLVSTARAELVLLSYSDEGHVPMRELVSGLSEAGDIHVHSLETIGRYRPNARASSNRDVVREYVIALRPVRDNRAGLVPALDKTLA